MADITFILLLAVTLLLFVNIDTILSFGLQFVNRSSRPMKNYDNQSKEEPMKLGINWGFRLNEESRAFELLRRRPGG